jgi:hypothetical protein
MGAAGSPLGKILETEKIEYLRNPFDFKKDEAERHPKIFN